MNVLKSSTSDTCFFIAGVMGGILIERQIQYLHVHKLVDDILVLGIFQVLLSALFVNVMKTKFSNIGLFMLGLFLPQSLLVKKLLL